MPDKDETEIPLPNVKGAVLSKVVTYLKYHVTDQAKEIEKPLKSANMNEVVSQWDADFVDVDQELLFELILVRVRFLVVVGRAAQRAVLRLAFGLPALQAANYMDIKPLLDLTCAKVASMIKGVCVRARVRVL